ncbi:MAG: hypothetical protein ACHP65_09305 [Legionellales bacterium]
MTIVRHNFKNSKAKMMKIKLIVILIFVFSTTTFAQNVPWRIQDSDNLACGDTIVHVESTCQDPDEMESDRGSGGIMRECRSSKIIIITPQKKLEINLPFMLEKQRKNLEKQGYDFSGIMKNGTWAPTFLTCLNQQKPLLLLTYQTSGGGSAGDLQNENVTSDSLYTSPVVTDTRGQLVDEKMALSAINFVNKEPNSTKITSISVNGVYGDEEKSKKWREKMKTKNNKHRK